MKIPLILQDINNNILSKNIAVNSPTFFIKSFSKFGIKLQENYEIDFLGGNIVKLEDEKIFDTPTIYSVLNQNNIKKNKEFSAKDANFSYTIFLGKTEKIINIEIVNINEEIYEENFQLLTIHYKPNNILLDNQKHYESLLINNDLPTLDKLLPAIIKNENQYDLIKKLLLDFKEIKKNRGKLKSIEKFLNFIGFNPDSIKLYPEYTTPNNTKTLNPNKKTDFKNGYYHVLYDNWIINNNDKYTNKNLPKRILQINNVNDLFEKLFYALTLANDYFTIPEQQMSFFGMSNSVNSEQYLSITSNMTKVYYIDTLSFLKNFNINIYNRTNIDSKNLFIVKNKVQKINNLKLSEVKIYLGNNIKTNDYLFLIEKEFSDNYSDTNLTNNEELNIEYLFGNVLNIELYSLNNKVQFLIKNLDNELIQFKSEIFNLTNNVLNKKIFIGLFGNYELIFYSWDNYGNREEYKYLINLNDVNIDFEIFNSSEIIENNLLTQDVDSTNYITGNVLNNNFELINSNTNINLNNDLKNYFDIVNNENHKKLFGNKQFKMELFNHNFIMKDITETLNTDYVDNFLEIYSIKKLLNYSYEFSENLFVKLMNIKIDENNYEEHYFITTKENSININKYLHSINILDTNNEIIYNINDIVNNNVLNEFEIKNSNIPVNYDFELYLDSIENNEFPNETINPIMIKSLYPRLKNINLDDINNNDDNYSLKIGDIIFCKLNNNFVTNATDIKWLIYNSFTNEKIYEINDYSLKYRITDKTLFDIKVILNINNQQYTINKKQIQTSFTL